MSTTYIPVELRRMVFQKAEQKCEYCLIHEDDTFFGCQVDHIIAEKHGGATTLENLALACTTVFSVLIDSFVYQSKRELCEQKPTVVGVGIGEKT